VIATDMAERGSFKKGLELLDYDIDYKTPIRIDALPDIIGENKLDLIVNAGILYHVFDPLESLSICRELIKTNGLLVLETQYLYDQHKPIMLFNPCDDSRRGNPHPNTFWRASKKTIEGMLEVTGFRVLGTKAINGRLTVLAQACNPDDINSKHPKIKNIHKNYMKYNEYGERVDYDSLKNSEKSSSIKYSGANDDQFIFRSLYTSDMPFQPSWEPGFLIKLKSLLNDTRFWIGTTLTRLL
jgi:hypothetical protein